MSKLKGAIVGFGNIAELGHYPTYAKSNDVEIVAVVEPSLIRQRAAGQRRPGIRVYQNLGELLTVEKVDFIDICTPPASHTTLALQALGAGCHVLCEKPLTLKPEEYRDLAAAVKTSGKTLFTVHNWKHAPIYRKAFEILNSGKLGKVWHVDIFTLRNNVCAGVANADWRTQKAMAGGGILVDHGWHAFYLLLNLMKADPLRVSSKMVLPENDPNALEEAAQTLIQFHEADAYIHLTWRADMRRNSAVVQATTGTLLIDDNRLLVSYKDGQKEEFPFEPGLSAGSHHADWFESLFNEFLTELRDPAQRGTNFREAGWCVALTSAAYESNMLGFKETVVRAPGAGIYSVA